MGRLKTVLGAPKIDSILTVDMVREAPAKLWLEVQHLMEQGKMQNAKTLLEEYEVGSHNDVADESQNQRQERGRSLGGLPMVKMPDQTPGCPKEVNQLFQSLRDMGHEADTKCIEAGPASAVKVIIVPATNLRNDACKT